MISPFLTVELAPMQMSSRAETVLIIWCCIPLFLLLLLVLVGGIVHYYNGPCASYSGPLPAVAMEGKCLSVPVTGLW